MGMTAAATRAVEAHVELCQQMDRRAADEAFRVSAIETARALKRGVAAYHLADYFKQATSTLRVGVNGPAYTSDTSVGYHARTGDLLLLPHPEVAATPREVQALVRATVLRIGAKRVTALIRQSSSQAAAFARMEQALDQARDVREAVQPRRDATKRAEEMMEHLEALEDLFDNGAEVTQALVDGMSSLTGRLQVAVKR